MATNNYFLNGRRLLAVALAGSLATVSILAFAHGSDDNVAHQGSGVHAGIYAPIDLAHLHVIADHVRQDATPDQLAKLEILSAAARPELEALNQQALDAHGRKIELLLQDKPDHAALERARMDEMQAADALSERIDRALTDLAQLLTPKQRADFREHFKAHTGSASRH